MKRIVEGDPLAMLRLLGLEGESAVPFDAEMSTISPACDYVLLVKKSNQDYLAHMEFQADYRAEMGRRMLLYGAIAHYNHVLPVYGALVLLRPEADGPAITGTVDYG